MKVIKHFLLFSILSSSTYVIANQNSSTNNFALQRITKIITGQQMADYLNSDYAKTVPNCGSATSPAFLCSGVLFRATNPDTDYNSWDPSPGSVSSGGVSFSYLRKDSKFSKLAYGYLNGFILYPYSYAPAGKNTDIDVACIFPVDADTVNRTAHGNGCGAHINYPADSGPCQEQGITTAAKWKEHYKAVTVNQHQHQCGFETTENSAYDGTSAFYQGILSMSEIASESINVQNELRLATWDTSAVGYPGNFPIEAFFYIYKQNRERTPVEKGLVAAQHDQSSYYQQTGIWLPIIRMSLPSTLSEDAYFTYSETDQQIPEPVN